MVNNWLLTAERHEHQDIKCGDLKGNDVINCFYKSVIYYGHPEAFCTFKSIKKLSAKPPLCMTIACGTYDPALTEWLKIVRLDYHSEWNSANLIFKSVIYYGHPEAFCTFKSIKKLSAKPPLCMTFASLGNVIHMFMTS